MRELPVVNTFKIWNKPSPYKQTYRCPEDCRMGGCPQHEATFEYYSVTDTFCITFFDGKKKICLDWQELSLIKQFIGVMEEK